ncbi:MAG: InlB B-repeat-containing protein, partial [Firmicutes bacterium]|nr:InlB B-repeat-containing protein [Bacillota bacterium]
ATVLANSFAIVDLTITLTDEDKDHLALFENGIFVEGFIFAHPTEITNQNHALSLPFLAFYGDWAALPVFDSTIYCDTPRQVVRSGVATGSASLVGSTRGNRSTMGAFDLTSLCQVALNGLNQTQRQRLNPSLNYLAINISDGVNRSRIDYLDLPRLRNFELESFNLEDAATGQVIYRGTDIVSGRRRRSFFSLQGLSTIVLDSGTVYPIDIDMRQVADNAPNFFSNSVLDLVVRGRLDFGDKEQRDLLRLPIMIDLEAPSILNAEIRNDGGGVFLDVDTWDNHFAKTIGLSIRQGNAWVNLTDGGLTPIVAFEKGQRVTTGVFLSESMLDRMLSADDDRLRIEVEDFAGNRTVLVVNMVSPLGGGDWSVVLPSGMQAASVFENQISPFQNSALNQGASAAQRTNIRLTTPSFSGIYNDRVGEVFETSGARYTIAANGYVLTSFTNQSLNSYKILDGTVRIEANAFADMGALNTVFIPNSVTRIGANAFNTGANAVRFVFESEQPPLLEVTQGTATASIQNRYRHFNAGQSGLNQTISTPINGNLYDNFLWNSLFASASTDIKTIQIVSNVGGLTFDPIVGSSFSMLSLVDLPSNFSPDGTRFGGWYLDSGFVTPLDLDTPINFENMTIYARHIRFFNVDLLDGDRLISRLLIDEGGVLSRETLGVPALMGHEFLGWFVDLALTTPFEQVTVNSNVQIFAYMRRIVLNVDLHLDDGVQARQINFGDRLELDNLPIVQRDGHTFLGWFLNSNGTVPFVAGQVETSFSLFPIFIIDLHQITLVWFVGDTSHPADLFEILDGIEFGTTITQDLINSNFTFGREGFVFEGWYLDRDFNRRLTSVRLEGDLALYARWRRAGCGSCGSVDASGAFGGGGGFVFVVLAIGALMSAILFVPKAKKKH